MAELELKLDEMAEDSPLKDFYTKGDDGKYHLNAPGLAGIRGALDNSRKAEKAALKELKDLKSQSGNSEELQKKIDEAEARIADIQKDAEIKVSNAVKDNFAEKVTGKLTDDPGQAKVLKEKVLNIVEIGEDGKPTVSGMEKIDQLTEHLREKYPFLCKPINKSTGGGALGGSANGGAGVDYSKMSPTERIVAGRRAKQKGN